MTWRPGCSALGPAAARGALWRCGWSIPQRRRRKAENGRFIDFGICFFNAGALGHVADVSFLDMSAGGRAGDLLFRLGGGRASRGPWAPCNYCGVGCKFCTGAALCDAVGRRASTRTRSAGKGCFGGGKGERVREFRQRKKLHGGGVRSTEGVSFFFFELLRVKRVIAFLPFFFSYSLFLLVCLFCHSSSTVGGCLRAFWFPLGAPPALPAALRFWLNVQPPTSQRST